MVNFSEEDKQKIIDEYKKFKSNKVGAHIDGPPFIALLINDKPGLQVVAGEGNWIDAPVTCRTAPGDYHVPVIPGAVIVNTGGTLMHLSVRENILQLSIASIQLLFLKEKLEFRCLIF